VSDRTTPKAHKDYRCQYCGYAILKGTRYAYVEIKPWDHDDNDGYAVLKLHRRCDAFFTALLRAEQMWQYGPADRAVPMLSDNYGEHEVPYYDPGFHREMARCWREGSFRLKVLA
jgi:ribosomal protein L24E